MSAATEARQIFPRPEFPAFGLDCPTATLERGGSQERMARCPSGSFPALSLGRGLISWGAGIVPPQLAEARLPVATLRLRTGTLFFRVERCDGV